MGEAAGSFSSHGLATCLLERALLKGMPWQSKLESGTCITKKKKKTTVKAYTALVLDRHVFLHLADETSGRKHGDSGIQSGAGGGTGSGGFLKLARLFLAVGCG